jgi:hypothetical protein
MDAIKGIKPGQSVTVKWLYEPDDTFLVLDLQRPGNTSNPPNAILLWSPPGPNSLTDKLWVAVNRRSRPTGKAIDDAYNRWGASICEIESGFDSIIRIGAVDLLFK